MACSDGVSWTQRTSIAGSGSFNARATLFGANLFYMAGQTSATVYAGDVMPTHTHRGKEIEGLCSLLVAAGSLSHAGTRKQLRRHMGHVPRQ